ESPAGYGLRAVASALAIGTVMLGSDSILLLSPWCKSVLAFGVFTALVITQSDTGRGVRWFIRPVLHLVGMYAALRLESAAARVVAISWLLLSLELTGRGSRKLAGPVGTAGLVGAAVPFGTAGLVGAVAPSGTVGLMSRSGVLVQMHWAGLAFALFLLCYGWVDGVWSAFRRFGEVVSWRAPMGLWVSGFQVYLMGVAAGLIGLVSGRLSLRALARGGAMVAALGITFVAGRAVLVAAIPVGHADVSALHAGAVICVALIIAGVCFRRPGPGRIAIVSSVLMAAILLTGFLSHRTADPVPSAARAGRSVGFYSEGLLDWRVPDTERLGLVNSGMFGILRYDLEQWANPVGGRVVVSDSISDEFLSGLRVLIFMNPSRRPEPAELAALERFVREGNAMLVLGDHTNIGGSRQPLNAILAFTGIRFNFDSAVPHRHGWHGCLEIRRHPVTMGVEGDVMMQLGVGASLEIERPAAPVIIARYGFSDAGDPANGGRGGFMGNIVHEGGEPVGDLVLAACQHVGRGRVLVFGDTSPFQNAALFLSRTLVRNSLEWLGGNEANRDESKSGYLAAKESEAIVDFSLKPDLNLELFSDRSLGGLANCLARAGITPISALERNLWDRKSPFLFLVNPTQAIGTSETEWLWDYMASGGNVVLAKGHASPQPVEPLLSKLGLEIDPVPLGGGDSTSALAHKEAWALSLAGTDSSQVRSRAFGYPTTVTRRVGAGTFTLIADGRAILDENLESELRGDSININFIINLIEDLKENTGYAEAETD
ncbi:hypothetical protein ACFL2Z_04645, partial [Candidatus Eisenbacteria bacterium]